ncbi:MAG TPA: hypothetical protein VEQ85_11955 [Lacipirellulaceae bacterium]|nr:hypothetical protein [Lacipirellulaceae bacterium]
MFRPRTTGWLGFDLGGAAVKSAQVVRTSSGFRLRSAAIVPRRERWDPQALTAEHPLSSADELQTAASLSRVPSRRPAAAVLPMMLCDAALVDEAARTTADLIALVEADLHQSLSGYVLASWPTNLPEGKLNVLAVPEAWSDQVSGDIAAGRWNCRALDALPLALARAVRISDATVESRTVAALDWGVGRATLCLIHHGAPTLTRVLRDCSFQNAIDAVSRRLRLSEADVVRALHQYASPGAAPGDDSGAPRSAAPDLLAAALREPLYGLEQELRRTLGYWQTQTRGVRPDSLVLFGGGASWAGLAPHLAGLLNLPVARWQLDAEDPAAESLPPAYLLGPAAAASALAWEAS